jgi:hypothetical protein
MQVEYQIKLKQQAEIISGTAWPLGMPGTVAANQMQTSPSVIH